MTSQDLTTKAMLVKLSISQWTARKHDKQADHAVESAFATKDAGRFNKVLIAREAVKAVEKTASAARTWHYDNTLPWTDEGYRILPAANWATYSEKVRELRADFERAVETFTSAYPDLVTEARIRLNGLFQEADYPASTEVRRKFAFSADILPLPIGGDFRVNLNNDDVARLQADITARTKDALEEAHADLYRRLANVISHMADKLTDPKAIFRDSLVENVRELVELLPRLDLKGDAQLDALRRQAEEKLCRLNPDVLRNNKPLREETAKSAKAILDVMSGLYQ